MSNFKTEDVEKHLVNTEILKEDVNGILSSDFTKGSVIFKGDDSLAEDNNNLFWEAGSKFLGIGTSGPNSPLHIAHDFSGTTGVEEYALYVGAGFKNADTAFKQGFRTDVVTDTTSGVMSNVAGQVMLARLAGSEGVTNVGQALWTRVDVGSSHVLNNGWGLVVNDGVTTGGSMLNQIGVFVGELTAGKTSNHAIYTGGDTQSYFGGNVGIGATTPEVELEVDGDVLIDNTSTEAFLVRKAGDTGDTFIVDTTNQFVTFNADGNALYQMVGGSGAIMRWGDLGGAVGSKYFDIINNDGTILFRALNDDWSVKGDRLMINAHGNIGVATELPRERLEVSGAFLLTDNPQPIQPTNAVTLFSSGGALMCIGGNGTVTVLAGS